MVTEDKKLQDYGIVAVCTHLGCVVPWNKAENKFICPCHGSQYDATGKVRAFVGSMFCIVNGIIEEVVLKIGVNCRDVEASLFCWIVWKNGRSTGPRGIDGPELS